MRKRKKYKKFGKKKHTNRLENTIINILSFILLILIILYVKNKFSKNEIEELNIPIEKISSFKIPDGILNDLSLLSNTTKKDFATLVAIYSIDNAFFDTNTTAPTKKELEEKYIKNYKLYLKKYGKAINPYKNLFSNILNEIKTFPVQKDLKYNYEDSFGNPRSYGGERSHLGVDIMDQKNKRGQIPINSITDGVIENIGWNELGGFRIGIRTKNNNYYYYAHFDSFAEGLKKGDKIVKGQFLGNMGDTGYSKEEGTKGNFAVHLHLGISPETKLTKEEFWINPYPFLKYLETKE